MNTFETFHDAPRGSPARRPVSPVQLLVALLLVAAGVAWLLDNLDVVRIPWRLAPSVAVAALGLAMLAIPAARRRELVPAGVVLSIVAILATLFPVGLDGGVGDRTVRPQAVADLDSPYRVAMGKLTLDLRSVPVGPGETVVEARVGMGQLVVRVPPGVAVSVGSRAGAGEVDVLGGRQDGIGVSNDYRSPEFPSAERRLKLELEVGMGQIEVTR